MKTNLLVLIVRCEASLGVKNPAGILAATMAQLLGGVEEVELFEGSLASSRSTQEEEMFWGEMIEAGGVQGVSAFTEAAKDDVASASLGNEEEDREIGREEGLIANCKDSAEEEMFWGKMVEGRGVGGEFTEAAGDGVTSASLGSEGVGDEGRMFEDCKDSASKGELLEDETAGIWLGSANPSRQELRFSVFAISLSC